MSFQKILVAIDNSPLCLPVFTAAMELARSNQATIKLLHCISPELLNEPVIPPTGIEMTMPSLSLINDYQTQQILMEKWTEEGLALLKPYVDEATRQGVITESENLVGDAGEQLCEVAKDWGADLVVVGRRGRTGLAEAFLGSVSNQVVHHAPCSVLVIQDTDSVPSSATTPTPRH